MYKIASLLVLCFTITTFGMAQQQNLHYLITGTYTAGKSEGIYVYLFNSNDGSYKELSHVKISNPTFLTLSPDEKFVYAVMENSNKDNGGEVAPLLLIKKKVY